MEAKMITSFLPWKAIPGLFKKKGQSCCPHKKEHHLDLSVFEQETKGSFLSVGSIRVWSMLPLWEIWMEKRKSFETDLDQLMVGTLSSYGRDSAMMTL